MPVGPWETFGQCVGAQKRKGYGDESARKICGKIEQQTNSSREGSIDYEAIKDDDNILAGAEFESMDECIQSMVDSGMHEGDRDAAERHCKTLFKEEEVDVEEGAEKKKKKKLKGKPYPFSSCISDQIGDGKSEESARKICGSIRANRFKKGSVTELSEIELQEVRKFLTARTIEVTKSDNGRYFVKSFLLNTDINLNAWGVTAESLPYRVGTFIGKPLLVYENPEGELDHPSLLDKSVTHAMEYQELFRVGNIIDIVNKDSEYFAISEVTEEKAKEAFASGSLPLYVSPAIAKLVAEEPEDKISNWIGIHLAVVAKPAYTVKKAVINGQCGGDQETCLIQLRKAHVGKYGYGSCGFCVKEVLEKHAAKNLATEDKAESEISNSLSSHSHSLPQNNSDNILSSATTQQTNPESSGTSAAQNVQPPATVAAPKVEEQKVAPPQQQQQVNPLQADLLAATELHRLKVENDALKKISEDQAKNIAELNTQLASVNHAYRKEGIERVLVPGIFPTEDERVARIQELMQAGLSPTQVYDIYKPFLEVKKANVQRPSTDYQAKIPLAPQGSESDANTISRARVYTDDKTGTVSVRHASYQQQDTNDGNGFVRDDSWLQTRAFLIRNQNGGR